MKTAIFSCLAAAAIAALGSGRACGDDDADHRVAREGLQRAKIGLVDAVNRALMRIPDGKAVEASLEDKRGNITYEIEVVAGGKHRILEVDPQSGKIEEVGGEAAEENQEDASERVESDISESPVTLVQAVETALGRHAQAKAFRVEPEKEHGKLVFSVSLLSEGKFITVDIDASSREIVHHKGKG